MKFKVRIFVDGDPHPNNIRHELRRIVSAQDLPRIGETIDIPPNGPNTFWYYAKIGHIGHVLENGVLKPVVTASLSVTEGSINQRFESRRDFHEWMSKNFIPQVQQHDFEFEWRTS
jgi:hypothetical protein